MPRTVVLLLRATAVLVLVVGLAAMVLDRGPGARAAVTPIGKPASLFVTPEGTDGGPCTRTAPCASWDRAYQKARPGQVIEVGGGTYPSQLIRDRPSARNLRPGCTPATPQLCIVLRPAAGRAVVIDGALEIRGSSVWVQGSATPAAGIPSRTRSYTIRVSGYVDTEADSDAAHPDHVIVEGIDSTSFGVFNVDTATFRNMDVGPATVGANCRIVEGRGFENKIGLGGDVAFVPRNVTISGLLIHNQNRNSDGAASDCHFGGLFLVAADGLVLRNTVFSQNAVHNIQVQNFGGAPPPRNITIENNMFGCPVLWLDDPGGDTRCDGQVDLQFNAASTFEHWLIRYNSFGGGLGQYVDGATYSDVRVVGNAGSGPSDCYAAMTFAFNAWYQGAQCKPSDRSLLRLPFLSTAPGSEDFQLAPGSQALAFVPQTAPSSIATDIEGRFRPLRVPRSAGALERDTALITMGRAIGSAMVGEARGEVLRTYGKPRKMGTTKLGPKRSPARTDLFIVQGGSLRVTSFEGKVVGVATSSPFYSTPKTLGVGSPAEDAVGLAGAVWDKCRHAFTRRIGEVTMSFKPAGHPTIREVSMLKNRFVEPCLSK